MFDQFPKTRSPLPERLARIYDEHYRSNREGETPAASLAQKMESWMHKRVANDVVRSSSPKTTLEIGAGTLNQLRHETDVGPYDIVEPFTKLYEGSDRVGRVREIYKSISDIPVDRKYDRITSVATFEHLCDLPWVIARSGMLLEPRGQLRVSIPSEGTLLWGLGWKLTTGIEFRMKYGLDYGLLMRHEHVNTALEIEQLLGYFFNSVSCSVLGIAKILSFYQFYACSDPRLERCGQMLRRLDPPSAG